MQRVQRHAGDGRNRPEPRGEQAVERGVQRDERPAAAPAASAGRRATSAAVPASATTRAQSLARAEVQVCRRCAALDEQLEPTERRGGAGRSRTIEPTVQRFRCVPRIDGSSRVLRSRLVQPQPELDVLDRRLRVPRGVEAARVGEDLASHGSEPRPERLGRARRPRVHVVVEQVAEARDEPGRLRPVVVGAEDGRDRRVGERGADPRERVGGDEHVRVDEDEDVAAGARGAVVSRRRRPRPARLGDHDQLLRRVGRRSDRRQTTVERRRRVGRGDDDGERGHEA